MAHLVPSIEFVGEVISEVEQGRSVLEALERSTHSPCNDFVFKVGLWLEYRKNSETNKVRFSSHYQQGLIEILEEGLRGAPVHEHLNVLHSEMSEEFERQWKSYLQNLPMKLSIPLLLFFFPAYVVLLFGPLVVQFLSGVQ